MLLVCGNQKPLSIVSAIGSLRHKQMTEGGGSFLRGKGRVNLKFYFLLVSKFLCLNNIVVFEQYCCSRCEGSSVYSFFGFYNITLISLHPCVRSSFRVKVRRGGCVIICPVDTYCCTEISTSIKKKDRSPYCMYLRTDDEQTLPLPAPTQKQKLSEEKEQNFFVKHMQ